jgi:phage tail sheath protein FI
MPATYKTPDVYVEEISLFPPSVAEVETAIPAFIGYTETARKIADNDLILQATEVYSLKEYETYFGGPFAEQLAITVGDDTTAPGGFTVTAFNVQTINNDPHPSIPSYLLYYAVKMFFDNGGGKCYIVSVGLYQSTPACALTGSGSNVATKYGLQDGLNPVALEDEPTMLVIPDAVRLGTNGTDYTTLVQAMLLQCGGPSPQGLRDRFSIFDVFAGAGALDSAGLLTNRNYFGNNYLSYGAAYYPFLRTAMNYYVNDDESNVTVGYYNVTARVATAVALANYTVANNTAGNRVLTATAKAPLTIDGVNVAKGDVVLVKNEAGTDKPDNGLYEVTDPGAAGTGGTQWILTRTADTLTTGLAIGVKEGTLTGKIFTLTTAGPIVVDTTALDFGEGGTNKLSAYKTPRTAVYNFVKAALKDHYVNMPPSGAVAGVYAAVDTFRGVWKAPANVSLADVIEPAVRLDNAHQDDLNVDPSTGKSINAIREFVGKGTLVWGARTLDGNSNEWRYVPVRRFFIMVEESVKKSTYWAVFEPNDANTWVKVRGMIENYLTQKWREGALAGATTKDAFFVKCGLGTTMTADDILNGLMNVEIGMAVVRPAEFIVLKFSHKLQVS